MQTAVANVRAKTKYFFTQKEQVCYWECRRKWVISEQKNRGVAKMVARNISSAPIEKEEYAQSIKNWSA